jgi:hypothetical protein
MENVCCCCYNNDNNIKASATETQRVETWFHEECSELLDQKEAG